MKKMIFNISVFVLIGVAVGAWFLIARSKGLEQPVPTVAADTAEVLPLGQDIQPIKVCTSIPLLAGIAEEIGGDLVNVCSVITTSVCAHEYEPDTEAMKNVSDSALFIKVGSGFDLWVDKLLSSTASENRRVLDASQGVKLIPSSSEHDADEHHHEEAHEHDANPHYWGNPENVIIVAQNVRDSLLELFPEEQAYLEYNYQSYVDKLLDLSEELKGQVAVLSDKNIVSYSAAFPYLYQYFGFNNLTTVETTCESKVTPKRLTEVANLIKSKKVKVIVGEKTYPTLTDSLVESCKIQEVLLWPTTNDSLDYLETLRTNVTSLITVLTK